MSSSRTVRYVINVDSITNEGGINFYPVGLGEWRVRRDGVIPGLGKPTDAKLVQYVRKFEESTLPGGCNEHLGVTRIFECHVYDQKEAKIVARYKAGGSK